MIKTLLKLFKYKTSYAICVQFVNNGQLSIASLTMNISPWLCVENYKEMSEKLNEFYGNNCVVFNIYKL
jgi:hypothetical protein